MGESMRDKIDLIAGNGYRTRLASLSANERTLRKGKARTAT